MGKKHRETLKENFTKNYLPQLRVLFQDWDIKVMSYVMLVIVMVAMIAATVAWFTHMSSALAAGLGITTASNESLKVEVKQEKNTAAAENSQFVEVREGEEDTILADLEMPVFDNVESYEAPVNAASGGSTESSTQTVSKLAPGVYGSVTIRLTALRPEVDHYKITPSVLMTYVDGTVSSGISASGSEESTGTVTGEMKTQLENLVKGHMLFFEQRVNITDSSTGKVIVNGEEKEISDYVHCDKYIFYNMNADNKLAPLSNNNPLTGALSWNSSTNEGNSEAVTLYWYWPYEYTNLSSGIQSTIQLSGTSSDDRKLYFDQDRMQEMSTGIQWTETQLYDYADTKIGTYVKSMKLHFEVEGYHEQGQAEQTTSP